MTKPLGYYASGQSVDTIDEEFGSQLERLEIREKFHLIGVLSLFLETIATYTQNQYGLQEAADHYPLAYSANVHRVIEILSTEPNESILKGLISAISCQIGQLHIIFNEALYNRTVTVLSEDGMNFDVARAAAVVVASDHPSLKRNKYQQEAVTKAWKAFQGHYTEQDEAQQLLNL